MAWHLPLPSLLPLAELVEYSRLVKSHMEKLRQERMWRCRVCGKTAPHSGHISEHIEVHHMEWHQGLLCPRCPSVLKTKSGLLRHIRQVHKVRTGRGKRMHAVVEAVAMAASQ